MKNVKKFTPEEIKEIRSRISVSVDNTGRFIRETRLQHHLSQSSLGSVLYVTKKAVSKWERGLCYPSMDVLPYLAETLGVTTDEILYAKFDTENKYEDNNKAFKLISRIFKNKYVKLFRKILIALTTIFLIWFFIENYNAVKIYYLGDGDDKYIHLENALLITTNYTEYLNIGYIYLDFPNIDETSQINYTIYIGDIEKIERIIQKFVAKNNLPHLNNLNNDEFPHIKIKDNLDKLYLNITYINTSGEIEDYTISLIAKLRYRSNDALHILKNINDSILKENNNIPELEFKKNRKTENELTIDLSFLYNMSEEEKTKKYNKKVLDKKFIINYINKQINIKSEKLSIVLDFNNNKVYYIDYSSNTKTGYIINKENKIEIDDKCINEYLIIKNILDKINSK